MHISYYETKGNERRRIVDEFSQKGWGKGTLAYAMLLLVRRSH